jgi:hypothetical protein
MGTDPYSRSLVSRAASALPDLATSLFFLWGLISLQSWRATLPQELTLVMIMEFLALHAGFILYNAAPGAGIGARLVAAVLVLAIYAPIAGAFAYFEGHSWPFAAFSWLLLSRVFTMLVGQGPPDFEAKRQRFYWSHSFGTFLTVGFLVAVPMTLVAGQPKNMLCWGWVYFGVLAVTHLIEQREWIENHEGP